MTANFLDNPITRDLLAFSKTANTTQYSVLIKEFQDKHGRYGPMKEDKQWSDVVEVILFEFEDNSNHDQTRYNLLRFLRLLAINPYTQKYYYKDLSLIYLKSIESTNGNIRNAGFGLLDNMKFGLGFTEMEGKQAKPVRENWIKLFITLMQFEEDYAYTHKSKISKTDIHGRKWRKHSTETQNKTLKAIRRGIETMDRGFYFDKILEEFDMLEMFRSSEEIQKYLQHKQKIDR